MDREKLNPVGGDEEEYDVEIVGFTPLIPEGDYPVRFLYHETTIAWGTPRVVLHFSIEESSEYAGIELCRYYNVDQLVGVPKKHGKFKISANQSLTREARKVLGNAVRPDRFSLRKLRGVLLLVRVRSCVRNSSRDSLDQGSHYSVVGEMLAGLPDRLSSNEVATRESQHSDSIGHSPKPTRGG
jgi:hypothetical protein